MESQEVSKSIRQPLFLHVYSRESPLSLGIFVIPQNICSCRTVSTCVRGIHGVEEDVFLSMPCSLGAHGVRRVVNLPMTPTEVEAFQKAAQTIWKVQKDIW